MTLYAHFVGPSMQKKKESKQSIKTYKVFYTVYKNVHNNKNMFHKIWILIRKPICE